MREKTMKRGPVNSNVPAKTLTFCAWCVTWVLACALVVFAFIGSFTTNACALDEDAALKTNASLNAEITRGEGAVLDNEATLDAEAALDAVATRDAETQSLWYQSPALGTMTACVPEQVSMGAFDVVYLPVTIEPESAQAGIGCNMDWMCGLDPCLCGEMDEWGFCACNGTETVHPSWNVQSESSLVHTIALGKGVLVVSTGTGEAQVNVHASMLRFDDASWSVSVQTAAFGVMDVLRIAAVFTVMLLVVFVIVRIVAVFVKRYHSSNSKGGKLSA